MQSISRRVNHHSNNVQERKAQHKSGFRNQCFEQTIQSNSTLLLWKKIVLKHTQSTRDSGEALEMLLARFVGWIDMVVPFAWIFAYSSLLFWPKWVSMCF